MRGHQTTLAFVRFIGGEPHYAFYDEGTAAQRWTYRRGSIPFASLDALHVGSTTLINDPVSTETLAAVDERPLTVCHCRQGNTSS